MDAVEGLGPVTIVVNHRVAELVMDMDRLVNVNDFK